MNAYKTIVITALAIACVALSGGAAAHCDSLDGPVVRDARAALEKRDPALVLKWVTGEREQEIRDAFARTLAVRALGKPAGELADQWFFETLVRVHRAGEGEAFTGLKAAGSTDPGIAAADAALESGSAARLAKELGAALEAGIIRRFDLAHERSKHAAESVAAGREYVSAYVDYIHFVETAHRLEQQGAPHTHQDE
jgi:uncharacterized protein DUF6448